MPETLSTGLSQRLRALVEETIAGTSVFVVDVVVRGRVGGRVVEIFLDADEGLGLDQLARLSREIGLLLDAGEVVDGKYRLDVSTPGVDRPLVARQFPRNVGRTLRVVAAPGSNEDKPSVVQGTLISVDSEGIVVREGTDGDRELSFQSIQEAKIVLPW